MGKMVGRLCRTGSFGSFVIDFGWDRRDRIG